MSHQLTLQFSAEHHGKPTPGPSSLAVCPSRHEFFCSFSGRCGKLSASRKPGYPTNGNQKPLFRKSNSFRIYSKMVKFQGCKGLVFLGGGWTIFCWLFTLVGKWFPTLIFAYSQIGGKQKDQLVSCKDGSSTLDLRLDPHWWTYFSDVF